MVDSNALGRAKAEQEMLEDERSKLFGSDGRWRQAEALCLSGGGIRSATFCLGVMQGLQRRDKLQAFHYLSTVSGGGYAGSWLSRWRGEPGFQFGDLIKRDGNGGGGQVEPIHPIRRLRSFSNYMSPTWGVSLDTLTVVTIFLRNLLFNLLVWVPVLLAMAAVPYVLIGLCVALSHIPGGENWRPELSLRSIAFGVPLALIGVWFAASVAVLLGPLGKMFKVLLSKLYAATGWEWTRKWPKDGTGETISRAAAFAALIALVWLLLFGVLVYLPGLIAELVSTKAFTDWLGEIGLDAKGSQPAKLGAASIGGGLFAALVGLIGFWSRNGARIKREAQGAFDKLGARLFNLVGGIAVLAILVVAALRIKALFAWFWRWVVIAGSQSDGWSGSVARWFGPGYWYSPLLASLTVFLGLLAAAIVISFLVGANRFSLHAMYGNRLTRAYLGTARENRKPDAFTDFDPEDDVALAQLLPHQKKPGNDPPILFHIINMTLNLTRRAANRRDWQERKAASFTATALHSGSPVTGYAETHAYGGKDIPTDQGGLTLGRAMTISGAAATPNMGYHSAPFVTMVMTFFNVRLGWWLPNPDAPEDQARRDEPKGPLLHLVKEALGLADDKSAWLYLSDGGHFDNLGLYEMVRRRCQRIVVVDGTCDGEFRHSDLHNAIRKAQVDFGVRIDLPPTLPGQPGPGAKKRVVVGRIRYPELEEKLDADQIARGETPESIDAARDGAIFIVKPILTGEEPPALTHYAQTSQRGGQTFPHHSTIDQFFNETQFESYRLLGDVSAEDLCDAIDSYQPVTVSKPVEEEDLEATVPMVEAAYPLPPDQQQRNQDFVSLTSGGHIGKDKMAIEATPPPPAARGWDGVRSIIETMSTTQLITSTVVAAGLIGGSLTIGDQTIGKLRDALKIAPPAKGVIELSGGAKALIAEGITVKVDAAALAELAEITGKLTDEVNRLKTVPSGGGGTPAGDSAPIPDPALEAQIERLKALIDKFPPPPGTAPRTPAPDLKKLYDDIRAAADTDKKEILERIAALKVSIAAQIKAASIQRNTSAR